MPAAAAIMAARSKRARANEDVPKAESKVAKIDAKDSPSPYLQAQRELLLARECLDEQDKAIQELCAEAEENERSLQEKDSRIEELQTLLSSRRPTTSEEAAANFTAYTAEPHKRHDHDVHRDANTIYSQQQRTIEGLQKLVSTGTQKPPPTADRVWIGVLEEVNGRLREEVNKLKRPYVQRKSNKAKLEDFKTKLVQAAKYEVKQLRERQ